MRRGGRRGLACRPIPFRPTFPRPTAPRPGTRRLSSSSRPRRAAARARIHLRRRLDRAADQEKFAERSTGRTRWTPPAAWRAMQVAVRNLGRSGLAATAISAVDLALWDLKAILLDLRWRLCSAAFANAVPIYGSGGFTSYDDRQLARQLVGWVEHDGCRWVKMKIGSDPDRDPQRVAAAKQAIGAGNAVRRRQWRLRPQASSASGGAVRGEQDVRWFEEPVSSDDLDGLRQCATARRPGWTSRRANMATRSMISAACWRRARSMCSRPTRLAAAASPDFCRPRRCARRTTSIFPRIARRRCIGTSAAQRRASAISNGFTTMSASSTCCSTARLSRTTAPSRPTGHAPGLGLELKREDAERFAVGGGRAGEPRSRHRASFPASLCWVWRRCRADVRSAAAPARPTPVAKIDAQGRPRRPGRRPSPNSIQPPRSARLAG